MRKSDSATTNNNALSLLFVWKTGRKIAGRFMDPPMCMSDELGLEDWQRLRNYRCLVTAFVIYVGEEITIVSFRRPGYLL